jgi:2'-5' RNA ligase
MAAISNERNNTSLPANNILVCSLTPLEKRDQFADWPPHVTILPWFSLPEASRKAFINRMTNYTLRRQPITITGDEEKWFGARHTTRVRTVRHLGALSTLHAEALRMVEAAGGEVVSAHIDDEFQPHVTYRQEQGIEQDETVLLRDMQLIQKDLSTQRKIVEHVFRLGNGRDS